jgi:N utilization substance protein B
MTTYRRRVIREKVLQSLYAYEISKEPLMNIQEQQLGELLHNPSDFEFAKNLIERVVQNEKELDDSIILNVEHWEFQRITLIDRIILRMGICELLHFPDIPPKVTINEAIELAKCFSTEKSGRFINGILDAVLDKLKKSGTLTKAGRGLQNETTAPAAARHPTQKPQRPR